MVLPNMLGYSGVTTYIVDKIEYCTVQKQSASSKSTKPIV